MQQKEEPPGGEVPGPPPPEVINLCQLSQGDEDSYMPEQIAGVKRRPEAEAESPDSDGDDSPDLDSIKMTRNPDARVKDNEDEEKTETNQPSPAIKEESVTEDETANSQDDNPPQFDDSDAVVLTFAEMHNYLHEEMKDLDNQAAKEVESANEYMQSMFAQVFTSHPAETLDDSKSQYPQLNEAEIEALLRLFIQDRKVGRADARKWNGRLYDITRAIYKSRRSLIEVVEHRITTAQVTMQPMTNMWAIRAAEHAPSNADQDVDMSDDSTSMFRFQSSTYSPEEVDALRRLCETAYGFPTQLRKPTEMETRIIKGLVEGTILCSKLPDFLKRICSNESLRKIQNTIQAQVEGDLIIKLQPEFPVYPDFQTKARLVGNITMGLENGRHDKQKVIALLQAAKQVYYDRKVHAVHIIFWTRELAAKWSREVKTLPFRNRTFPLVNEHPEDTHTSSQGPVDTEVVWRRQVGADGVKNENPRDRYHVRLLNVSRCMDEAAIDAYIRQQFHGIYTTWQEPSSGSQTMQTDTWDIFFKWPGCPSFLSGKRFVNWDGVKILVHHVSAKASYPCFQCGVSGHNRNRCNMEGEQWMQPGICVTVTAIEIANLQRRESTITSVDDLDQLWQEETAQSSPIQEHVSSSEETSIPLPQSPASSKNPRLGGDPEQWQTATRGRQPSVALTPNRIPGNPTTVKTPRSILKYSPESKPTSNKTDQTHVLQNTARDTEEGHDERKSPAEVNRVKYGFQSQQMEKAERLIMTQVREKRVPCTSDEIDRIKRLDIKHLKLGKKAGVKILKKCGLEEVKVDPNGNCQYYSVAMVLLHRDCNNPGEVKLLETLTNKLKKGIAAAANHFFEEEFPHHSKVQMLEVQNGEEGELTPKQSAEALRCHFKDIAGSKSQPDSYIDRRSWGSTATLRMLAKMLHRNIYMVEASKGVAKANFSLFTAGERVCNEKKFTTVKERIFSPEEAAQWMTQLQNECNKDIATTGPPIVLIFRTNHYNWLRFSSEEKALPNEEDNENSRGLENTMDFNEDFPMEDTERAQLPANQEALLENEEKSGDEFKDNRVKSKGDKQQLQAENNEHDEIEQFGGTRKEELTVFSTAGVNALVPAHRQPLRELDMKDEAQVMQWCMQYEISEDVLGAWQRELLLCRESQETFTPSQTPSNSTSDSQWSEAITAEASQEPGEPGTNGEGGVQKGVGRFTGETDKCTSTRQHMKQLRSQWNQKRPEWERHTTEPFPTMPSTPGKWSAAILAAPNILRDLLQSHSSPDFILSDMTEAQLDTWTKRERYECLIQSLEHYARQLEETDTKTADWVTGCIRDFQQQAATDMDSLNLFPTEMWKRLKQQDFGNSQLLRLCRKSERKTLARMIILATVYNVEIHAMVQSGNRESSLTTMGKLATLFELLERQPKIHALICQADSSGLWVQLETMLAGMDLCEDADVEIYEGSESPAY